MRKFQNNRPKEVLYGTHLEVIWADDTVGKYNFKLLRYFCPCASCVDEITGDRIIEKNTVREDVQPLNVEFVGNYAIRIHWSDGHSTGIYTFESLREKHPSALNKE